MTKAERDTIANTILNQLGGNRFITMTGANSFSSGENGELTFKYPHRKGFAISGVKIALNGSDLYDMEFIDLSRKNEFTREMVENLCFDQLQDVFTSKTGLRTSL